MGSIVHIGSILSSRSNIDSKTKENIITNRKVEIVDCSAPGIKHV
jgi:transcriptional regulatory protein LevR